MTTDDDDLARRLRGALGRPRSSDRVDADDFLSRVHHGAKMRRVKRGVATAAAGVLVVAGGGLAINASGYLGNDSSPVADDDTGFTQSPPISGSQSVLPPTTGSQSVLPPTTTQPSQTKRSSTTPVEPSKQPVTITPHGPIKAADATPISLTATGTAKQWVLAKTPGDDCQRTECATVFATTDHGKDGSWTDVGQLPAAPPAGGVPTPDTVSQLRFTLRADGSHTYDGWAFGNALWSTHDSGQTWTDASPGGSVSQLEAWGGFVYAGVSSGVPGDDTAALYRSPTTQDAWATVQVRQGHRQLTGVQSLAAAKDVVGLIDSGSNGHAKVYVSTTGDDGTWQREDDACPRGTDPLSLSTASEQVDPQTVIGALWVTCQGALHSVVRFTDSSTLGSWHEVLKDILSPKALVAAQSGSTAFVAGAGQISKISATTPPAPVAASGFGAPVFFGFTNDSHGYLLDADGTIVSTTDGGQSWTPYQLSDTP